MNRNVYSWLQDYEDSTIKGTAHLRNETGEINHELFSEAVVGHPLMTFRMIRRFVKLLPLIVDGNKGIDADAGKINFGISLNLAKRSY